MTRLPEPDCLLTIARAAELLGISVRTLRRWAAEGRLVAYRQPMTGRRLFRAGDVWSLRGSMRPGDTHPECRRMVRRRRSDNSDCGSPRPGQIRPRTDAPPKHNGCRGDRPVAPGLASQTRSGESPRAG